MNENESSQSTTQKNKD